MSLEVEEIWEKALDRVRQEVLRPSFETWLRNSEAVEMDSQQKQLIVAVPHEFAKNWISENYSSALKDALYDVTGTEVGLDLVVDLEKTSGTSSQDYTEEQQRQMNGQTESAATEVDTHSSSSNAEAVGSSLNPKYTFDNFVIGSSNRLAHAASLAVSQAPALAYNPLFLYGGVGLGKTHLMQAIAHKVLQDTPSKNVVYVSSERFANELINSIRDTETVSFRNRYRTVDVLLIDDIQFLAGKERTQEEFFHTFNALHEANRQIVISSDRPPKEIPTLEERLRSRFEWGLISDIQPPDLETRIAILRKKAQAEDLDVPDKVLRYIAESITTNIRELEGALVRLVAFSSLRQQNITMDLADEALRDLLPQKSSEPLSIKVIQDVVSQYYNITGNEMTGRRRTQAIVFPRQVAMYLSRHMTEQSLPQIGEEFGGRDHSTVIHACNKIKEKAEEDPKLQSTIQELKRQIEGGR